jgi:hypothetical protein
VELDFGVIRVEVAQHGRQELQQCRGHETDPQSSGLAARRAPRAGRGCRRFLQDAAGAGQESLADGGRVHTARGAVEQGGADLPLERGDLLGQWGLRDADGLGGAAEVPVLGQGEGVAQMPQLHPPTISQRYHAGACRISALPAARGAVCSGRMAEPIKPTGPGP